MSQVGGKVSRIVQQLTDKIQTGKDNASPQSVSDATDGGQKAGVRQQETPNEPCINEEMENALMQEFSTLRDDRGGYLPLEYLHEALHLCNVRIPAYKCRVIVDNLRSSHAEGRITFAELREMYSLLKPEYDSGSSYIKALTKLGNVRKVLSASHGAGSTLHSVSTQEQVAFSVWVERQLQNDPECLPYFPFVLDGHDLYSKCTDGVLLCKLVNLAQPGTIFEKAINRPSSPDKALSVYQKLENLRLALNSARALGCNIINIGPDDLMTAKEHLLLGLVWQLIKVGLTRSISASQRGDIAWMMSQVRQDDDGDAAQQNTLITSSSSQNSDASPSLISPDVSEEILVKRDSAKVLAQVADSSRLGNDLRKLTPEQIILNWVNYQLVRGGSKRRMANFGDDLRDSEIFAVLLSQIAPQGVRIDVEGVLKEQDRRRRAERVIQEAARFDAAAFITPDSVVEGNSKLNLAFLANLFNTYPAIEPVEDKKDHEEIIHSWQAQLASDPDETREERTYRNWMNSLGIKPPIQSLYTDLRDACALLQLYDIMRPGVVDITKVHTRFHPRRRFLEEVENCNYAVTLGASEFKFKLIGISGNDLHDGNMTLTLSLVAQAMRAYTLNMLAGLMVKSGTMSNKLEKDIIDWANAKLRAASKPNTLNGFQDVALSDGRLLLDLIEAIRPFSVRAEWVKTGYSEEDKMANARLAITLGRKIGANIYALPEDIVEVQPKMMLITLASLMATDLENRPTVAPDGTQATKI